MRSLFQRGFTLDRSFFYRLFVYTERMTVVPELNSRVCGNFKACQISLFGFKHLTMSPKKVIKERNVIP